MGVRSIRITSDLEKAIDFVSSKEKIEKSQSLRKLAGLGFEAYVSRLYKDGEITLREASRLLGATLLDTMEVLEGQGVRGNVGAAELLSGLKALK